MAGNKINIIFSLFITTHLLRCGNLVGIGSYYNLFSSFGCVCFILFNPLRYLSLEMLNMDVISGKKIKYFVLGLLSFKALMLAFSEQKAFNWSLCRFMLQCSNRDILGGWCDSGSIFVVDVIAKGE